MLIYMQAKVLEFWTPAPLPEGDAGKDAVAPTDMKKPEAAYLEVSSDSSIGGGSDVEVVGGSTPSTAPRRRRRAILKVSASKAGLRSTLPKGSSATASRSGSEEPGAEDAPELSGDGAGAGTERKEWKAAAGLMHIGEIGSPLLVPRPQPSVALLRLSFTARRSGRYVKLHVQSLFGFESRFLPWHCEILALQEEKGGGVH
jgi:hypothetical protein